MEDAGHTVKVFYPKSMHKPGPNEFPSASFEFKFYSGYRVGLPVKIRKNTRDLDLVHIHGLFSMAIAGYAVSRLRKMSRAITLSASLKLFAN